MDCKSCRYASWGENGKFLGCKSTCGLQKTANVIEKMQEILDRTTSSDFETWDEYFAYLEGVSQCIKILENEQIGGDYE